MNMNKNVLEHMDKAAYIILLCIAAVAVLVSMVTGPLGYKSLSIGAAVSAAIIAAALLWHTAPPHRNTNDKIFRIAKAPQLPNQSVLRGFLCL